MGIEEHDHEGRIITLEYDQFYLVTCYTPNSQTDLKRLDYRMTWEDDVRKFLKSLDAKMCIRDRLWAWGAWIRKKENSNRILSTFKKKRKMRDVYKRQSW